MKRTSFWFGCFFVFISVVLELFGTTQPYVCMVKYLGLAYGITFISMSILTNKIQHRISALYYIGILLLLVYTILVIDTYYFHALTWFPGIIRYPLFSLYGIPYLVFIGIGYCIAHKEKTSR